MRPGAGAGLLETMPPIRWLLCLTLAACSGGNGRGGADGGAGGGADAAAAVAIDRGDDCPMGCHLTLCADTASTACSAGVCVWDGRTGADAYCSQPCGEAACPAGWACLAADDGSGAYCFAEAAVCGNAVRERGEVCDPGPTTGQPESG